MYYYCMAIMMAYDGMPHTEKALEYAIKHAAAYNQPLYFVSSVQSKESAKDEKEVELVKGYLEKAKQKASTMGVEALTYIEVGEPAECITKAAERLEANTIIVGRHKGMSKLDRLVLGSVSEYVIRHAGCTVIVVQ
jgi:Universal stress protein UspA and related nucleotide-binding proteins